MAPTSLNFNLTALAENAAANPAAGKTYQLVNLAYAHVLSNWQSNTTDNNPVVAEDSKNPVPDNMLWTYLSYPSSNGDTVFTLQAKSTVQGKSAEIDGRGGYLRVDITTNRLVHGGQPMPWKLIQVAPSIFEMMPFEDVYSEGQRIIATDVLSTCCSTGNQVALQQNIETLQQLWTFNPAPSSILCKIIPCLSD